MKIALEALGIHYFGGGRTATMALLETLFAMDTQNEYTIFLTQYEPKLETPAGNVRQHIAPTQNRFATRIWAQANIPHLVDGYDLLHFMKNLGVVNVPTKTVTTVYDMTTLLHPELFPTVDVWYWRTIQRWMLHATKRIIAISGNTAQDIAQIYQVPEAKIEVIYQGQQEHFKPVPPVVCDTIRAKYQLPERFILHVGHIDPKKNLSALVLAFARFRQLADFDGKLVFVGEEYKKSPDAAFYDTIRESGLAEEIVLTGVVPDEDIAAIFSAATACVIAAIHEGFGFTALEALSCGTPLITTRAGAIAEVVADAAILYDGGDIEQLAAALVLVTQQPALREAMREYGLTRAEYFSWAKAAQQHLDLYHEVVHT